MEREGIIILLVLAGVFILMIILASRPGVIARKRRHPSAEAINVCGWIGLVIWPCWIVAYIWAHTVPDRLRDARIALQTKALAAAKAKRAAGGPDPRRAAADIVARASGARKKP